MKKINDISELTSLVNAHFGREYATNYFLSRDEAEKYIANGDMLFTEQNGSLFIIRRKGEFSTMYYSVKVGEVLDLSFLDSCPWDSTVVETAFREKDVSLKAADEALINGGAVREFFRKRMAMKTSEESITDTLPEKIHYAEDVKYVYDLMHSSFSPLTGCLPTMEETDEAVKAGEILCHDDGGILHFKKAKASYELRHLCVDERARGQGIGASLVEAYNGIVPKKSVVWVREGYTPAEKIYENNGYTADGMRSSVLIYKKG